MAAPVRYLSGRQQQQKIGIEGNTDNQKVLEVVGQVGIGTTIFEPSKQLDVRGDVNISGQLTVGGNTFGVDTETRNLNVSGISTFTGAIDANGNLDVDGHTELDDVNVSGASTFTGLIDANGGINVTTARVEDLTENRIVIVGGAGTASQTQSSVTFTSVSDDNLTLTNGTNADISMIGNHPAGPNYTSAENKNPSVTWDFNVSSLPAGVSVASYSVLLEDLRAVDGNNDPLVHWSVSGIPANITNIPADAVANDITGATINNNFNMTAFGQAADGTNGVSVVGYSGPQPPTNENHIYRLSVTAQLSGGSTGTLTQSIEFNFNTANTLTGAPVGTTVAADNLAFTYTLVGGGELEDDANLTFDGTQLAVGVNLDVDGHTELDDVNVSGASTFTGSADFNGDIDVDGHTELDNLRVSGVSTFIGDIDVDGHTELDNLRVSGVSTFIGAIDADGSLDVDGHTELDDVNVSGASTFTGNINANGNIVGDNATNISGINSVTATNLFGTLQTAAQTNITSVGTLTGLDVNGHTELDNVNVSGASTFTGNIDANGNLDVDGHTELDDVNVSGVSTFTGNIDANGNLDVDGHTELDDVNVSGVSTFTGAIDANGDIDVDGHTELDNLNVSGVSTFVGLVTVTNGDVHISQRLFVGGLEVEGGGEGTFTGINTFTNQTDNVLGNSDTGAVHFNGGVGIDKNLTVGAGLSVVTGFEVGGASTFTGNIDANGNLDVDGHTELDDVNVSGASTFTGNIDANGNLDVDGHTELDNVNASGISSATAFANFNYLQAPFDSTVSFTVTVASKSNHRYQGQGSGQAYYINGVESPFLTLTPGRTYRFNLSASDQLNHPFRFYLEADKTTQYTTNVTTSTTYTEITITDETPVVLHYQCLAHGYMGNAIQTNSNVVNTNYDAILRGGLDVDGHTELDNLNVSGLSTFASAIDANNGLDVSGAILNVTSGLVANSAKVSDLTDNRIVIAGASGELEDSSKLTFDGSTLTLQGDASFNGNVTIGGTLTKEDVTDVDSIGLVTARTGVRIDAGGLVVSSGVSTFTDNIIGNLTGTATTATNLAGGDTGDIPYQSANGATTFVDASGAGNGQVLLWGGSAPIWASVSAASGNFGGITLQEEGSTVGTASSIIGINFIGDNVTAAAGSGNVVGSVTISDTPTFDSLKVTGISTIPSVTGPTTFSGGDVNVGTAITFDPVSGIVSATAFYGSGENLTDVLNQKIEGLQVFDEGNNIGTGYTFSAIDVVGSNISVAAVGLGTTARITLSDTPTFNTVAVTNDITANGNIVGDDSTNISGINSVTATSFHGALSGNATSATTATNVTVTDESTDTTCFPLFVTAVTGDLAPKSGTNLTFNSSNGTLTSSIFSGSGASLTNIPNSATTATDSNTNSTIVARDGSGNFSAGTITATLTGTASNASGATGDFSIADKIVHTSDVNTAIRFPAADTFTVETDGSERLRVDSNGRLLLGTSNSRGIGGGQNRQLQVEGTSYGNSSLSLTCNSTSDASTLVLGRSRGGIGDSTIVNDGDDLGYVAWSGADGTDFFSYAAWILCEVDGTPGANDMPGRLVFSTTPDGNQTSVERMRISSSGNVGINRTNPSEKLDVNGNVKAVDFNTTSDRNLKENIQTIENPLAKVAEIRGVNFDWKETQKPSMGVIAQEVEKVLPELVTDSGTKTVNYNGLIGLLIEVVKDQQTQINSLNERLSQLE